MIGFGRHIKRLERILDAVRDDHSKLKRRIETLEKANVGLRARVKELEERLRSDR